jgi:hypothetical protein
MAELTFAANADILKFRFIPSKPIYNLTEFNLLSMKWPNGEHGLSSSPAARTRTSHRHAQSGFLPYFRQACSTSRQLGFNQTIDALRMLENADDLEAGRLHEAPEFGLGALARRQTGQGPVRALVGQDELVEQDLGVAFAQGRHELLPDVRTFRVAPVLHDGVQEVRSCTWCKGEFVVVSYVASKRDVFVVKVFKVCTFDRLWRVEVMHHLLEPGRELCKADHLRPILQDQSALDVRVRLLQTFQVVTSSAADVD